MIPAIFILLFQFFSPAIEIPIEEGNEKILTYKTLPIWIDSTASANFETASTKIYSSETFNSPSEYNPAFAYWIRLDVALNSSREGWLMEFYDQSIDDIDIWQVTSSDTLKYHFGDLEPFNAKAVLHKNFILPMPNKAGHYIYYIRVENSQYADIRIVFRNVNRFIAYAINEYYLYGLFYGMILIISIYNMLTFLALRERKYLFYIFYIVSVAIYSMCIDGIAYQYLWPNAPKWNQIASGVALFFVIVWAIQFSRMFLVTRARAPKLDLLLRGLLYFRIAWFLICLFVDQSLFAIRGIELLPLSVILIGGIYTLRQGYTSARFFVVAYSLLFTGFIVKAMVYLSIVPFFILSYYSIHIGFLMEMVFLTFALSDRLRILKVNRDRAMARIIQQHEENVQLKEKVNRELEDKIRERTSTLQELNQKLEKQSGEINQINSMLDLENFKLRNNIKQILADRLINDNLNYDEFRKIFPDKNHCLRYLSNIKWEGGFNCRKCGHDKAHNEPAFKRRCTRCGFVESPTSNTIFHRNRIPLEKAFYLLYVMRKQEDMYTLQELSELTDIHINTILNFRKKVKEALSSPEKIGNKALLFTK